MVTCLRKCQANKCNGLIFHVKVHILPRNSYLVRGFSFPNFVFLYLNLTLPLDCFTHSTSEHPECVSTRPRDHSLYLSWFVSIESVGSYYLDSTTPCKLCLHVILRCAYDLKICHESITNHRHIDLHQHGTMSAFPYCHHGSGRPATGIACCVKCSYQPASSVHPSHTHCFS